MRQGQVTPCPVRQDEQPGTASGQDSKLLEAIKERSDWISCCVASRSLAGRVESGGPVGRPR